MQSEYVVINLDMSSFIFPHHCNVIRVFKLFYLMMMIQ